MEKIEGIWRNIQSRRDVGPWRVLCVLVCGHSQIVHRGAGTNPEHPIPYDDKFVALFCQECQPDWRGEYAEIP